MKSDNSALETDPKAIFLKALDCESPEELARFLDDSCGLNPALRSRVDDLLKAHQEAGRFLGGVSLPDLTSDQTVAERPGSVIGPYKLLEQIGEGGFGVVFLAEQQHPVRRRVALKILKAGMDTREVIARFEAERQALAMMDHRHIAKVLDAGATESGRPYFVMELIHGIPITDYCDGCNLTLRERLDLFLAVCQAVQHAHQKGIIHRDIKPTNVLVAIEDGKPSPKVIDFGVAKAVSQRLTEQTLHTAFTQIIGTPLYISPEQAEMSPLGVDTRTDIYALGVLLYELLTGTTPFEKERLQEVAYDEMRRIIREEEPPPPSSRVSTLGPRAETVAENRRTDVKKLCQNVRGDLDWIVMKSLEKDRNRRYETASALAADVEHYLHDEPVEACPPSAVYRFRKFARRNKTVLATTTVVSIALLLIVGGTGWELRDRATKQAVLEQQVTNALDESRAQYQVEKLTEAMSALKRAEGLLASGGGSAKLIETVSQWRADLETVNRLEQLRLEQAAPANGLNDTASTHSIRIIPDSPPKTASKSRIWDRAGADLAYRDVFRRYKVDLESLDVDKSVRLIRESPIRQELVTALDDWFQVTQLKDSSEVKRSSGKRELLQIARLADPDPWRDRLRDAIQRDDDTLLSDLVAEKDVVIQPPSTVLLLVRTIEARHPNSAKAIEILRHAQLQHPNDFWINFELAVCLPDDAFDEEIGFRRVAIALRPGSLDARSALAGRFANAGRYVEAESVARETIRQAPEYARPYIDLGVALFKQGKTLEAEAALREAKQHDSDDPKAHFDIGVVSIEMGKIAAGEAALREAIRLRPDFADAYNRLNVALFRQGKYSEAEAACREAMRLKPDNSVYRANLSDCLQGQGKFEAAEAEAHEAIRMNPDEVYAHQSLGNVLIARGKYPEAEAAWREAVRLKPDNAVLHGGLTAALEREGKYAEAEPEARETFRLMPENFTAQGNLSLALNRQGKYAEAEEFWHEVARLQPDNNSAHREIAIAMLKRAEAAGETPPWDEATVEFVKAIDLSDDKRYHGDRIVACTELARWDEVFNRVAQLRPNDTAVWIGRARDRALRSRWAEAMADYANVIHERPSAGDEITEYAYLLVLLNDVEGFQQFCCELLARSGEPKDADAAFQMARALAAAQCEVVDPSRLVEWATKAVDAKLNAAFLHGLGLAQYRAGRYEEAVDSLEKSNASDWSAIAKSQNLLVLAMAHCRLGQIDEARHYLETGRKLIDGVRPKAPGERVDLWAPDWIPMQVLLREAEALLTEPALEHQTNPTDN